MHLNGGACRSAMPLTSAQRTTCNAQHATRNGLRRVYNAQHATWQRVPISEAVDELLHYVLRRRAGADDRKVDRLVLQRLHEGGRPVQLRLIDPRWPVRPTYVSRWAEGDALRPVWNSGRAVQRPAPITAATAGTARAYIPEKTWANGGSAGGEPSRGADVAGGEPSCDAGVSAVDA